MSWYVSMKIITTSIIIIKNSNYLEMHSLTVTEKSKRMNNNNKLQNVAD